MKKRFLSFAMSMFVLVFFSMTACSKKDSVDPNGSNNGNGDSNSNSNGNSNGNNNGNSDTDPVELTFEMDIDGALLIEPEEEVSVDFMGSGIESITIESPKDWIVTYDYDKNDELGAIHIKAPSINQDAANYDEEGNVKITVEGEGDQSKEESISVSIIMPVFADISLTDVLDGVSVTGGDFLLSNGTDTRTSSLIKNGDDFRLIVPVGYNTLMSAEFTSGSGSFAYYFEPETNISTENNNTLSLEVPELFSYWGGGIIIKINEDNPSGIDKYNITGITMSVDYNKLQWSPHSSRNTEVQGANSDTDGEANTDDIIAAYGAFNDVSEGYPEFVAAQWVRAYRGGGFDDWYLWARAELAIFHALFQSSYDDMSGAVQEYGGVAIDDGTYWASTVFSDQEAVMLDTRPWSNQISFGTKNFSAGLFAIRKF